MRSRAVSRVCRRDDTKMSTGLAGEWLRIAVEMSSKQICFTCASPSLSTSPSPVCGTHPQAHLTHINECRFVLITVIFNKCYTN